MSPVIDLVRDDLRTFTGYASARRDAATGHVWLNANEAAWPSAADPTAIAHRYPDPQPAALRERLAAVYGVPPARLLLSRGSDEAIDLLVRALCHPGRDAVVATPPVFGMYEVAARCHGAPRVDVPLVADGTAFRVDVDAVAAAALAGNARVVFLCSPSNPTGGLVPREHVLALARRLAGRCVVVLDEAYVEYAGVASLASEAGTLPNLAVLRTLSKAHALAGARIGALVADPGLVAVLRTLQAPYPLPSPSVALAMAALGDEALAATGRRVGDTIAERGRLAKALVGIPGVVCVHPSAANFLLVRFVDARAARAALQDAGIVVRAMDAFAGLEDALRITIGDGPANDALLAALAARRVAA